MTSIDILELDLAEAREARERLQAWIVSARATERAAPLSELATGIAHTIALAERSLIDAEGREGEWRRAITVQWEIVRAMAHQIASRARTGDLFEHLEDPLLALLGTHELPADGLDRVEHAFVSAALKAREAAREADETFAAFVTAREALVAANDGGVESAAMVAEGGVA